MAKETGSSQKPVSKEQAQKAFTAVKEAKQFAIGGVGYAGTISPAELAFRDVLAGPDALARCQSLVKEATAEGRLYGLLGLKRLDAKAYEAAAPAFQKNDAKVSSASGCIVFKTTVAEIAKNIAAGKLK
jgi:hypothetical protein